MAESSRYAVLPALFTIAFAITYAIAVDRNLALFTYHPALGEWGLGVQASRDGPAMYWYGWLATSGLTALAVGLAACFLPRPVLQVRDHGVWAIPVGALIYFAWLLRGFFSNEEDERVNAILIPVLFAALQFASPAAMAGDDADTHDETGPRLFGFIRDADGKAVSGAKVTATIKGFGALVARSNATGAYRVPVPGLGQQVQASGVSVSCEKEGYRQLRVVTRTPPGKKPLTALEVDCRLQAVKGK